MKIFKIANLNDFYICEKCGNHCDVEDDNGKIISQCCGSEVNTTKEVKKSLAKSNVITKKAGSSIDFNSINPENIVTFPGGESEEKIEQVEKIITDFRGTMFTIGFIAAGSQSFRVMNARSTVNVYKVNNDFDAERSIRHIHNLRNNKNGPMIGVYENELLINLINESKFELGQRERNGEVISDEDKEKYIEIKKRKAYRNFHIKDIQIISGRGQIWVNEKATDPRVRKLIAGKKKLSTTENSLPNIPIDVERQNPT